MEKWSEAWSAYQEARQTKIWFPIPDPKKSHQLLNMKRGNLGRLVQFLPVGDMLDGNEYE